MRVSLFVFEDSSLPHMYPRTSPPNSVKYTDLAFRCKYTVPRILMSIYLPMGLGLGNHLLPVSQSVTHLARHHGVSICTI